MLHQSVAIATLALALGLGAVMPPAAVAAPARASVSSNQEDQEKTVLDVAIEAGAFKTLVAAIKAADLEVSVNSPGPLTVFAPTDEAFAKLPAGTVESLLLPENRDKLVKILTYHVVPGQLTAAEVMKEKALPTAAGMSVPIKKGTVGGAKIVKKDIPACNGVIHVIDRVMLP